MDARKNMSNVKRLIDANKLIDFIDVGHLRHPGELCYSEVDVANILLHAPAMDAVEVVRCRDCGHGAPCTDGYVRCQHPSGKVILMKSSDFCSYGERKEGADNG